MKNLKKKHPQQFLMEIMFAEKIVPIIQKQLLIIKQIKTEL